MPGELDASFISNIFGSEAKASSPLEISNSNTNNSQTLALLEAGSFAVKETKKDSKDKAETIDPEVEVNIVEDNALLPVTGPLGVSDGTEVYDFSDGDQLDVYVVRTGDTYAGIASMFDISVDTILSFNDIPSGTKPKPGDILFISSISAVQHTVKKGETLAGIAKAYGVDIEEIKLYNDLDASPKLAIGDELVIPGAKIKNETKSTGNKTNTKSFYSSSSLKNIVGYFINPVPTGHKTQGLHGPGHRGIDIGAPRGTPIYASAGGVVSAVKSGCVEGVRRCGGGYGNMVIVTHPNGTRTLYAHMSKLNTSMGAQVSRGQMIGYVGSTGLSTGPHIHFEVFNAKNPGSDWSWAK